MPKEVASPMKRLAAALAVLMMGFSSACASSDQRVEVRAEGSSALPSDSLQSWVTYGDYLVTWRAASERRLDPTPEEIEHNEGTITRLVTLDTSQVLWRRPSASKELAAPKSMEVANGGWVFHGKDEKPFVVGDEPRIEVGKQYVAILSYADVSVNSTRPRGPKWLTLTYFEVNDGVVVPQDIEDSSASTTLNKVVGGKLVPAVTALVAATPIEPAAKPYLNLDPVLRFQKVEHEKTVSSSYTPGPGPGEKE